MAGAEKIKEKILEEARLQAQKNLEQAEKEAADILEAAKKEAQQKKEAMIEKSQKEAVERKKRLIAVAELEGRKQKLQAKQVIIEESFEKTLQKLSTLPTEKYQSILTDMIASSAGTGEEEVIISDNDAKKLGTDFIQIVNKKVKEKGLPGNIVLSDERRNMNGGFVLRQGDIEINNSFDAIIRMQRDELESEVVKALF
ncbi:V-type ATP synthase subunit E family protein [Petroclostridium sp. X23]|jgi:V/A-type H+-transporting ATPase subunit E|uniref:V-type ATP synthase subunit E n=1 Tax=Petroclostridium sp. X23 TaxID=3045146 RepID=UPI0024ACF652|nr:V-type ATP synthase subunit E family protein [Petroclostridium sp. X23]WHH57580.1 V-type ATP synthase subunit E family protein [Petroclostridium sp. X23]